MSKRAAGVLAVLCSGIAAWAQMAPAGGTEGATTPFSFVVFGDNQFATENPTSGVPERLALPKVVASLKPTFILHTGDLMDHGYDAGAYDRLVDNYRDMLAGAPFFPTMGNHDAGKGIDNYAAFLESQLRVRNATVYGDAYGRDFVLHFRDDPQQYPTSFSDPGVDAARQRVPSGVSFKTYYSIRFRNLVVISLEQGTRWWANTPLGWLEETLRAARRDPGVAHVIVTMHHPLYSTVMLDDPPDPAKPGSGECMLPVRRLYEGLFRKYDVTLVFSGHAHLYDRFCVPDDGTPTRSETPPARYAHDGTAVHYVVTGGGGGPLNPGDWKELSSWPFSQKRVCAYHVVEVQVQGRELRVRVHLVSGNRDAPGQALFEEFCIGP